MLVCHRRGSVATIQVIYNFDYVYETKPSKGNTNHGQRYFRTYVGVLKDNGFQMKTITTPASRSADMDVGAEILVSTKS